MNTFIGLDTIKILGRNYGTNSVNTKENSYTASENVHEEVERQQSVWKKLALKVKNAWETVKPVVSGLTTFFTITTAFVKSMAKLGTQCKNLKAVFA